MRRRPRVRWSPSRGIEGLQVQTNSTVGAFGASPSQSWLRVYTHFVANAGRLPLGCSGMLFSAIWPSSRPESPSLQDCDARAENSTRRHRTTCTGAFLCARRPAGCIARHARLPQGGPRSSLSTSARNSSTTARKLGSSTPQPRDHGGVHGHPHHDRHRKCRPLVTRRLNQPPHI